MNKSILTTLIYAATASIAFAQSPDDGSLSDKKDQPGTTLVRVRGVIENATDTSVTVKTSDGTMQQVMLKPDTAFVNVIKSSLDKVGENKFIGTATKGDNPPTALEVVIFPDDMKGTGEGH